MPAALWGLLIVVVEDDPDALALFQVVLEYEGALVMAAPGAQSALDMLNRMRPQVLVTDMTMPERATSSTRADGRMGFTR